MKLKTILKMALLLGAIVEFFVSLYAGIADAPMVIMKSIFPGWFTWQLSLFP